MPTTIAIAVADTSGDVVFADRCVGCGGARSTASTLAFAKIVTNARGRQSPVHVKLAVPHCEGCARSTKAVFLAAFIPFVLGFLAAGGAAFTAVALVAAAAGVDEVGRPVNANSLVLGAAAGLVGGLAGGFVLELVARVALMPVYGRALLQAPLLVPSLFSDGDHVAGLRGRANADLSIVTLTFAHDDIAQQFAADNALRVQPSARR